ncbi:MAG TPA: hypothetical protein PKD83_04735 [Ignavibacteria bacterium]|nr:hypothetical protein [Ignavibacteria bacterium]
MSEESEDIKTENTETENTPLTKKKSIVGRIFKWIFLLGLFLILLVIGILLFIQTDTFDKMALGFVLDKVNTSLESKDCEIYAESLEGNILKGITLKNGSIRVKKDTLIKFNSIETDYNILSLLKHEISVQNVIIRQPQINLTTVKDKNDSLKWNFDYFLSSDEPDEDTTSSEFDWGIIAENVQIKNGSIRILENKNSDSPIRDIVMRNIDTVDFSNLDVNDFNLNLSGRYFPDEKDFDIKKISFTTNSKFNVDELSLQANINEKDSVVRVRSLTLLTDRSDIKINEVLMNNLNPFKGIEFEKFDHNFTRVDMSLNKFNFDDIVFFIPELNFLDSVITLDLKAEGNFGDLTIDNLDLKLPNSQFTFSGNVKNLDAPDSLYFNLTGKNIEIDPKDTRNVVPGLDIPDYSNAGRVIIPSVTYIGEPENFTSDLDVRTGIGNVMGKVGFDLRGDVTKYKGDISVTNLDLGKIVKDNTLESNINGDFVVDAEGFDYRTATGKLNYKLNRTKFLGQNISRSDGQLNFNRGDVGLDISYDSEAIRTKAKGKINISNINNISYDVKGTASNLNIASFTKDNSMNSNLSFDFELKGRGFDPNVMEGSYKINMNQSTFGDLNIPAMPLELDIDKNGVIKKVSLKSEFADLNIDGAFDFNSLITVINSNIDKISYEFSQRLLKDSLRTVSNQDTNINTNFPVLCKNLSLTYSLNVKDLTPVYSFTGIDSLNFIGNIDGTLSDSCGLFNLTADADIKKFAFKDSLILTDSALLDINISNNISGYKLSQFNADIFLKANKLIVSRFKVDSTKVNIGFIKGKNNFSVSAAPDSLIKLMAEGRLDDSLNVAFDTLYMKYKEIQVTNNNDLIVGFENTDSSKNIVFKQFTVNSLKQKLNIAGFYSLNDSSSLKLSAKNISLITIQKILNPNVDTTAIVTGNVRRVELVLNGNQEFPEFKFEANSDVLKVGGTRIGRLDAFLNYSDNILKPDITFTNISSAGNFKLIGNFPFLTNKEKGNSDSVKRIEILKDKDVSLDAVADNFQLKVLQQLLPYTTNLEGILNGKISLMGTFEKPLLTGNMKVGKGKFYVTLNKMNYDFNADVSTENNKLVIRNSKVFVPEDPSKFITTTGYLDLTNLDLNEINLDMTGDVKAFDKKNGQTELGIAGDLWVGSGKPGLKIRGSSDRIDLTGNLILIKGNLVFNPFGQSAYNIYSDDFDYGIIIDSLKTEEDPIGKVIMESKDSVTLYTNLNLNPFEKVLYSTVNKNLKKEAFKKSGKFFYNLYVTTQDNVFLKFIVNEKSQQEFFGEIRTDLYIDNKENYQMSGRGVVNLGNNCYYKFFRKFDATGKAVFNGPITNPELDISATYKGYNTTGTGSTGQQEIQDVIIDLDVSGYATNPVLTVTLDRGRNKETGSNATSDAVSFLLFGKFKDQLSFEQSTSLGANIGASYLSNFLSNSLENILPWLINTDINYLNTQDGNIASNADVRFTAAIGDAIVRFGGQIFKGIANTDIIIDYPLNKLLKIGSSSRQLFIRAEKVFDPFSQDNDVSNFSGTRTGALIYYKIKF